MFELSPSDTAANANASSIPACVRVSRSKPRPVTLLPPNSGSSRRNASGFWSMTDTECPLSSRLFASVAPTRPHPMITKCTVRHAIPSASTGAPRAVVWAAARGPSIAHRVGPLGCRQTPVARTSRPQRQARPHAPAEAHRAAGVRVGRALVGGVRARRDPADALARRDGGARHLAVGRSGRRRGDARRRRVLPAERARLPVRRRRLRGRDDQPGQERRRHRRQRAAGRLRAHRRGVDLVGRPVRGVRVPARCAGTRRRSRSGSSCC